MAGTPIIPPDDVPRSPSGRVPQWVRDEAAGKPVAPAPFRGAAASVMDAPSRSRRQGGRPNVLVIIGWLLVSGLILGGATWVVQGRAQGSAAALAGTSAPAGNDAFPAPGQGESDRPASLPVGGPVETPTSGFRFQAHQKDRVAPVTWSPCRRVHYVVRAANAPPGGASVIASAFAQLHAATGLTFVDDGATTEGPTEDRPAYQPDRYGTTWAPVLVAWATHQEVPDFGIDVLGESGPNRVTTASGDDTYVSGIVYLDSVKLTQYARAHRTVAVMTTVLHEIGHLVGLAHVDDRAQIMYPADLGTVRGYAKGDLAGLSALGRGQCQPDA